MRLYKTMILAVLLAMAGRTLADNLTVEAVTLMPGETKQVAISLENPQKAYAAFQFDLLLPEGISMAKNEKGKFIASLDEDRKDDHTLNVSEKSSGVYRLMTFSMSNADFYGLTGPLVYVMLQADGDASTGAKTATIAQQVFTEWNGDQSKWADVSFTVTVGSSLLIGDVTGEGNVNAADVTALVNYILGRGTLANEAAAYVNDDTKIDIQDVTALIGIIKKL